MNNWFYNEFAQIGKDYSEQSEVDVYEETHSSFRDLKQEARDLVEFLEIKPSDVLVDYGCGTGVFAIEAAKVCSKVYAVDISKAMLEYAKEKAQGQKVKNIEFCNSGFLNFELPDSSVDIMTSTFSLHHLPDYWKGIALRNLNKMLKTGGKLYIKDVIIQEENSLENIQKLIDHHAELGGDFMKDDAEQHFKQEFSTYDWVVDQLLERAGFNINNKVLESGTIGLYLCSKN